MRGGTDVRQQLRGLIPRQPDRISTVELVRLLASQGVRRTARAVQKLCAALANHEPDLVCDDRSKPYQWSWKKDARVREYPTMNAHTALTLTIAFEQARHLLPTATLEHLRHQQRRAEEVLSESSELRGWRRKLRVLPRGLAQLPPRVDRAVLHTVYEALFAERRLRIDYRRWRRTDVEEYEVNPIALVNRGPTLTLVCTRTDTNAVRQLHLHRMQRATALGARAYAPPGFDLDAHIRQGNVGFRKGDAPLRLRLQLHADVVPTVSELALAEDQRLTVEADGSARLEATVADTLDLRGWLKSYGPKIEVLAPAALRKEIAAELREAAALYAKG